MSEQDYLFKAESKKSTAFNMQNTHRHNHHEIYYLKSGERYYFIDDRIYHVNQGDILFIPKNAVHRTTAANNEDHERTVIYFQSEFLLDIIPHPTNHPIMHCFYREPKAIRLKLAEQNIIENILSRLVAECNVPGNNTLLYQQALLLELLIIANRIIPADDNTCFNSLSPIHEKIHNIVRYIRNNYQKTISLTGLAKQFYISQYYLSRMFKEVTGLTLIEYVNNIRIRQAQDLLLNSTYSITEISGFVGFENQTYFGRMFKRITGFTPREFRSKTS